MAKSERGDGHDTDAPNHAHIEEGLTPSIRPPPCPRQGGPGGVPPLIHLSPPLCSHPSSEEWQKVSKSEREKMGVTVQDDGEFW